MNSKPTVLVILDGFGYSPQIKHNAIAQANKPNIDAWLTKYPHAILNASGTAVGLLNGYMGNSEVGHITIGAGRVVKQPVTQIHQAIDDHTFFENQALLKCLRKLKQTNGTLHLMGLLSDAGVHSHEKHLYALLKAAQHTGIRKIVIHPFLDGRDVPPKSAKKYINSLEHFLKKLNHKVNISIGSIHGRFYAMDRDYNWNRIEQSYKILTEPQPIIDDHWTQPLEGFYEQNITDEFIPPTQINPQEYIKNGDGVIFFNFRPDRARQLTAAFTDPEFDAFPRKKLELACFVTPVPYKTHFNSCIMFEPEPIEHTLKEILNDAGKRIFAIAETEKYAHVTYFFGGGKEEKLPNEIRVLIPSIRAENYINSPCMSADEITQTVIDSLQTNPCDFYIINYANADMVGHSGNFEATVKAIECLDKQLEKLYTQVITKMDGTLYITADHGNAEDMFDEKTGQPRTAHTNNPVPFIMIRKGLEGKNGLKLKGLADIAPFILQQMGIKVHS